nr:hypothetical protein [Anaerolineae bacterium]
MSEFAGMGGAGLVPLSRVGAILGSPPLDFDYDTFTAGMAKRATSVFAAAPIVQGDSADGIPSDTIAAGRGSQVHNDFYARFDPSQGSVVVWWTPEFSTADRTGNAYIFYTGSYGYVRYEHDNNRFNFVVGTQSHLVTQAIVAGTTYCIVARWDTKGTLDGTNHACLSVNNSHTFGMSTRPDPYAPDYLDIGTVAVIQASGSNAIIEGLTVYRRPLYDSNGYG